MNALPTPVPVEEGLRQGTFDIGVPNDGNLTVGPFEEPYSHGFRLLEVRAFAELQRLGLVPLNVSEDQLVKAYYTDDRRYRELLEARLPITAAHACSCGEGGQEPSRPLRRFHFQNELVDVLQPVSRRLLKPDDLFVLHTFGQLRAWLNRPPLYLLGYFLVNNITIGARATLTMTPTIRFVRANDITIGGGGNLTFRSANIHVKCQTLNGPGVLTTVDRINKFSKYVVGLGREEKESAR